jgi:hypothetical protein
LVKCPEDSLVKRGLADLGGNLIYVRPDYRNRRCSSKYSTLMKRLTKMVLKFIIWHRGLPWQT